MKRILSVLLIVLLLVCPLLTASAEDGAYVNVPDGYLDEADLEALNAHAKQIALQYGVAVYYICSAENTDGATLIAECRSFAENVPETNAVVLSVNPSLYYMVTKGVLAKEIFPESVCDEVLWEAYRSVKGDYPGKIRAYLDAAGDLLEVTVSNVHDTDGGKPAVVDRAGLLSDDEAGILSKRLVDLGSAYRCDIVVVTVDDLGETDVSDYADDFFDYNGYGYGAEPDENGATADGDGILLLISIAQRQYCLSTSGKAIEIFSDDDLNSLAAQFTDQLSADDYMGAFFTFADGCEQILRGDGLSFPEVTAETTPEPTPMPEVTRLKSGKLPVVDMDGLLRPEAVTALSEKLVSIADRYQCDIVIVTVNSLGGKTATEYADDFFDYNGYGYNAVPDADGVTRNGDGILLLVSMEYRDYAISTSGFGIKALTDYGIEDLEDRFLPDLSKGDYEASFNTFADRCAWLLDTARKGRPYDVGYRLNLFTLALAILAGLLLAFIPVSAMKRQLTDVKKNMNADRYLETQSFALTQNSDVFLNSHVSRTVHVEPQRSGGGGHSGGSSTHTSSSGGTHGGHSGKF